MSNFVSLALRLRIHLSLLAILLSAYVARVAGVPLNTVYLAALFTLVTIMYGFNALTDQDEDSVNDQVGLSLMSDYKNHIQIFLVALGLAFVGACIYLLFSEPNLAPALLLAVPLGLLYSIKPAPHLPRLKQVHGLKNLIPALIWSTAAGWPTLLHVSMNDAILLTTLITFSVIDVELLWDWRDISGDLRAGVGNLVARSADPARFIIIANICVSAIMILIPFFFEKSLVISPFELSMQMATLRIILTGAILHFIFLGRYSISRAANLYVILNIGALGVCHSFLL